MLDIKNKMIDIRLWFQTASDKVMGKCNSDNNTKVRNFIIIPDDGGRIIMATENSGLSHENLLQKLWYKIPERQNIMMNYPCGYYQPGKIVLFQGDLSRPETIKPLTKDNRSLIEKKFNELKRMLKCGDKISVQFHRGKDNTSIYFQAQFDKIREIVNSLLHAKTKSELAK